MIDEKPRRLAYRKEGGKLIAEPWYQRDFLKKAYSSLLLGHSPTREVVDSILSTDFKPNSLIYYPYQTGGMKAAALVLMKMKVSTFRAIHTHYLVEVFVGNSEEDGTLSQMYSPFWLLLHGFIPTPNRRLLDLIQEFVTQKTLQGIPFVLFTTKQPDPALRNYCELNGLDQIEIRSGSATGKEVF